MSMPDLMRQKAAIFQRAARRNPEKRKELLGVAQSLQFAANVGEEPLPEAKRRPLPVQPPESQEKP